MALYIGTSGWAYPEWKARNETNGTDAGPGFYPARLPSTRWLEHYSRILSACEINVTFRNSQSDETYARWARSAPDEFRYAIKVHRRLTHVKQIAPEGPQRDFLDEFLRSAALLGPRLGVMLFQYPPTRKRDDGELARLLDALPDNHRFAFEFRHESWDQEEVHGLIASHNATAVLSETAGAPPTALPPGPFAYIRLRAAKYSPRARKAWRLLLQEEGAERDVYVFTKHEGVAADNPYGGIGLAQWLVRKTKLEHHPPRQPRETSGAG
ncbi:MAG: DUF72 domain-containing protein [Actinobacteria bacterium]|nr:DUF72 domain-containing protein [Actinomycetota bacterium]